MSECRKCGKPVYFAERKTALGYDWHRECFTCAHCNKALSPGQHADHNSQPYCHVPCYGLLFGPAIYGHGTRVEMHGSYGGGGRSAGVGQPAATPHTSDTAATPAVLQQQQYTCRRSELERKISQYNQYYSSNPNQQLKYHEDGSNCLVVEGLLKVHWGVSRPIKLKTSDDVPGLKTDTKSNSGRHFYWETNYKMS